MAIKRKANNDQLESKTKKLKLTIDLKKKLEEACRHGNMESLKFLLKIGFDLDKKNEFGMTALHQATESGHVEIVKELLAHGANIDLYVCCDNVKCNSFHNGNTALMIATINENVQIVTELLKYNPNLIYTFDSYNCLHTAYNGGKDATILGLILAHARKSNTFYSVKDLDISFNGERILHMASRSGQINYVQELLKYNVDSSAKNEFGQTALQIAAKHGHSKIVAQLLLRATYYRNMKVVDDFLKHGGIQIDFKSKKGFTLLHIASMNGFVKIVQKLLENGATIDLHVGFKPEGCNGANCEDLCYPEGTALYLASKHGHLDVVKMLLKHGATLTSKCSPNILSIACGKGHLEVVKELLGNGAKVNEQVDSWMTTPPIFYAVEQGKVEVMHELIKHGANVNAYDDFFGTPINVAILHGNLQLVKELLKYGANPYQQLEDMNDDYLEEETPIQGAAKRGYFSILEEILLREENDASLNDVGSTSVHYAAYFGNADIMKKLLERGCKANVVTSGANMTPLHIAVESACMDDNCDTVSLLLKYGGNVNAQDIDGDSALHKAVRYYAEIVCGDKNMIVETILEKGTNVDYYLKNNEGKTALQVAIDEKDTNTARMLAKKMCPKSKITHSMYPLNYFL